MSVTADSPKLIEHVIPISSGVIADIMDVIDNMYGESDEDDVPYDHDDIDAMLICLRNAKINGNSAKLRLTDNQWKTLEDAVERAIYRHTNPSRVANRTHKFLVDLNRGLSPSLPEKAPPRRKFETFVLRLGGIDVEMQNFSATDSNHKASLGAIKHAVHFVVNEIRKMFGKRSIFPTLRIKFGNPGNTKDYGVYHPKIWETSPGRFVDSNVIELFMENFQNQEDWRLFVEVIAHEYGHYIWHKVFSAGARRFWAKDFDDDVMEIDTEQLRLSYKESGMSVTEWLKRQREHDPVTYRQLESVRDWNKVAKMLISDRPAKKPLMVRKHPITRYGETNAEEAFCEAYGYYMAYGPRTLLPAVRKRLSIVLPEASIATSQHVADLMEAAAMRIFASLKGTNMIQVRVANFMKMDLMEWIIQYGAPFRSLYQNNETIRRAVDSEVINDSLVKEIATLLQNP